MQSWVKKLPIYEVEKLILEAVTDANRMIIQAPTGSGKSTQVPQMLKKSSLSGGGEIHVLQPRWLAARMLAQRVARKMGTSIRREVDYQVRFESKQSGAPEHNLPEQYLLPSGRKARIRYESEPPPVLSARIQQLYDIDGRLTIADGCQRLKIKLLGPNQWPIQVTDDLTPFCRYTYPEIKPAPAGRFPKNELR